MAEGSSSADVAAAATAAATEVTSGTG